MLREYVNILEYYTANLSYDIRVDIVRNTTVYRIGSMKQYTEESMGSE